LATIARKPLHVDLERALSKLGLASRSGARALIRSGRVSVDGRAVTDPHRAVIPERVAIAIDNTPRRKADPVTVLLHKPRGVVTTRSDPEGRPTVFDLLNDLDAHVAPVGRLDLATSGLLLLTNDTRLADWLTDPKNAIPRVYLVTVRGRVSPQTEHQLVIGLTIDGEHLSAAKAHVRKASNRETHLVVTLLEGKNREIRRLFLDLGHSVTRLRRVQFGGLMLDIPPGKWRIVSQQELDENFPGRPRQRKSV
jgi:23S rRNA pseudouridine2605 synthase